MTWALYWLSGLLMGGLLGVCGLAHAAPTPTPVSSWCYAPWKVACEVVYSPKESPRITWCPDCNSPIIPPLTPTPCYRPGSLQVPCNAQHLTPAEKLKRDRTTLGRVYEGPRPKVKK